MNTFVRSILTKAVPGRLKQFARDVIGSRFQPYTVNIDIEGTSFVFLFADEVARDWYSGIDHLSPELKFLKGMVEPEKVILDVGAHHGFISLLLAKWGGEVVAFEASPYNSNVLQKEVTLNEMNNITVENKAVGLVEGRITISGGSNVRAVQTKWDAVDEVEMISIDKYCEMRSISPDLIKIDVEGFEVEVLKGAQGILEQEKPKLAIEVHLSLLKNYGHEVADVLDLIDARFYDLWLQYDGGTDPQPYSGGHIEGTWQVHLYAFPKS